LLPTDLPVVDHHAHLSPSGEGIDAVRRFRAAGGTHLFLATQNYDPDVPLRPETYERQFETTARLAARALEETGVVVYVVLAPYPIDLLRQVEKLGLPAALDLQRGALETAGRWVRENRAVALGEVGRPHFPFPAALAPAIDEVFRHALRVARDCGCPAVVHSEDLDAAGYRDLAELARQESLPPGRLVKHYERQRVAPEERQGIATSFLAKRDLVRDVASDPGSWFLETDFLDDPGRPGAVLDLATVPRRARALAAQGPEAVERLRGPFERSVRAVYGITPLVGDRAGR
jgi:TatD-related deoxyribonuclease